jgi:hypothetical protein
MENRCRAGDAAAVSEELLDLLENQKCPISQILLKAKRLARLLRDDDAQRWLNYELSGYPDGTNLGGFGSCSKYARQRMAEGGKFWSESLPTIETRMKSSELALTGYKFPTDLSPSLNSPSQWAGLQLQNAITNAIGAFNVSVNALRESIASSTELFNALTAAVHSYATEANIALALGSTAQEIFEAARLETDNFIRLKCPKAAEQLLAAYERIQGGGAEECAQALLSCRRVLLTVADALFPPRADVYQDRRGRGRKVGPDEYKNRLLAYLDSHVQNEYPTETAIADLEHVASRLDVLYENTCKGIHADVDPQEARLTLISTYLILAEVARTGS